MNLHDTLSEPLLDSRDSRISHFKEHASETQIDSLEEFDVSGRTRTSRTLALVGVGVSIAFGILCIVAGILIVVSKQNVYNVVIPPCWRSTRRRTLFKGMVAIFPDQQSSVKQELIGLLLNLAVTACTEAIGFVHAMSLKSALAAESRLRFNTNLRLLTAAHGTGSFNPNGTFFNAMMAILLILSYVSSSIVFLPFKTQSVPEKYEETPPECHLDASVNQQWKSTCIFAAPIIVLGVVILLQAIIALLAVRAAKVMIWSSSPIDVTVTLLQNGQVTRHPGRCMRSVLDADLVCEDLGPQAPSSSQPSAWRAHKSIRNLVKVLWVLTFACVAWGGIVIAVWSNIGSAMGQFSVPGLESWALFPSPQTNQIFIGPGISKAGINNSIWAIIFSTITVIQGSLTLGLHCSELLVDVIRDEDAWRDAACREGTNPPSNPLVTLLGSWPTMVLLITKPIFHWLFGLSLNVQGNIAIDNSPNPGLCGNLQVTMRTVQIWYLGIALLFFSLFSTYVSRRCPRGPQPAAYGHVQTLANLVDEWSLIMWWGHKTHGPERSHAGTSNHPLPLVEMDSLYAGMSHESKVVGVL